MKKQEKIISVNHKLFSDISIEELDERLQKEELDERIQCWTCGCNCDDCDTETTISFWN